MNLCPISSKGQTDVQQSFTLQADSPAVTVYTDGGCDPNPGPGGWAALLRFSDREIVIIGNSPRTTNNRMEIQAAIAALAYLSEQHGPCQIDLHTDSEYLRQGITQWIGGWFARGWKAQNGRPIKNQALWHKLHDLTQIHRVRWHWVKGHAGDLLNERVDQLAREARSGLSDISAHSSTLSSLPAVSPPDDPANHKLPRAEMSIGVSCRGSVGPGGWAVMLRSGQRRKVLRGYEEKGTSNVLLLKAAVAGLSALKEPSDVTVYTVSDYLGRGASQWVQAWQGRQWRTEKGEQVKNREHWEALIAASRNHRVSWQVVRDRPLPGDLAEAKEEAAGRRSREEHS